VRPRIASLVFAAAISLATVGAGFMGTAAAAAASGPALSVSVISTGISKVPPFTTAGEDVYIIDQIYGSLLAFKPGTSQLEASLATKWQVSNDSRTWTFDLRHGVQWQDGYGTFTCADVQFTWQLNQNPKENGLYQVQADTVQSVSCPNPYEVVFHLKAPNSDFGQLVANQEPNTGFIMSKAAWAKLGEAGYNKTPVGTGPYELQSLDPNVEVVLQRNPHYWGPEANVATIDLKVITDDATAALAVQSGALDIAQIDPVTAEEFAHSTTSHIIYESAIFPDVLMINTTVKPFNNVLVREAMRYAINYNSIKEDVFRGHAGPVTEGIVLPGEIGYSAKFDPLNVYDPAKAKALLKQSGVKLPIKGFFDTYNTTSDISAGELIQEDLSLVGIDLTSRPLERGTLDAQRVAPTTPAAIIGAVPGPDPSSLLDLLIGEEIPPAGLNISRYNGINTLFNEQLDAPNAAQRLVYLHEIEQKLTADVPAIIVDNEDDVWIVNNKVEDYYPTALFSGDPLYLVKLSS
jgi:peptide/nickel transport system substrate-binding protein